MHDRARILAGWEGQEGEGDLLLGRLGLFDFLGLVRRVLDVFMLAGELAEARRTFG